MIVTEIVSMELIDGISADDFINIVDTLEHTFHKKCKGFLDSELFKDSDNHWFMIMHWESKGDLKEASKLMMSSDITIPFRSCINPKTIKIDIYNQLLSWK